MRKFLTFLASTFVLTVAPLNIIACGADNSNVNEAMPNWVSKMINNNPDQINIGYDNYLINDVNHNNGSYDRLNQHDYLDINENNKLYFYLPEANNIDEAIKNITVDDSASPTWTINIENSITWQKLNDTTYTNNNFITEDTVINNIATMDVTKYNEIKNSNIANTWTAAEKDLFNTIASIGGSIPANGRENQNWWNGIGWEKLLSTEKIHSSNKKGEENQKFSQLDLYNRWINQRQIGMNVPLSLMAENSFTLQATNINHVFSFSINPQQVWLSDKGEVMYIPTPHWGFTVQIEDSSNSEATWVSSVLVYLKNAFKEEIMNDYLATKAQYWSFNNQEKTKFASLKIN